MGKPVARTCTNPTSGHNLAFFDMGSFARVCPRPNDSLKRADTDALKRPTRTILHGHPHDRNEGTREVGQTSCTNVHKANLGSQLSIFDTSSFTRVCPRPNNSPKRVDTNALKQPDRTILHRCLHDQNKATRDSRANELHECAQSQPWVTT